MTHCLALVLNREAAAYWIARFRGRRQRRLSWQHLPSRGIMHFTYHDSEPHTSVVSAPSAEAGAPVIKVSPAVVDAVSAFLWSEPRLDACGPSDAWILAERILECALEASARENS
jgi:hypothetical protein